MLKDRVKQQETITRQVGEKIRDEAQDRVSHSLTSTRSHSLSLSVCEAIMCTLLELFASAQIRVNAWCDVAGIFDIHVHEIHWH